MRQLLGDRFINEKPAPNPNQVFVDMHSHSTHSDGMATIKKLATKAKKHGYGVSITDHNEIQGVLDIAKDPDVFSIPGIEVSAAEGIHILMYFYNIPALQEYYQKHIEPYKVAQNFYILKTSTMQVIRAAQNYPCIMSAAHPFGAGATGLCRALHDEALTEWILERLHAIEVFNAGIFKNQNKKALQFCNVSPYGITGGSDAHSLKELGFALTHADTQKSVTAFLDAVKNNQTSVIGKECPNIVRPYTKLKTASNFVRHPVRYGMHATRVVKKSMASKKKKAIEQAA